MTSLRKFSLCTALALSSIASLASTGAAVEAAPVDDTDTIVVEQTDVAARVASCDSRVCWAHAVVFRGSWMENYRFVKNHPGRFGYLDLNNNGCSIPSWIPNRDALRTFFRASCVIHDFGYRNFGPGEFQVNEKFLTSNQDGYSNGNDREYIDKRFRDMMKFTCDHKANAPFGCKTIAEAIFQAVRSQGDGAWANV